MCVQGKENVANTKPIGDGTSKESPKINFANWAETFHTNSTVQFPKSDKELREIIENAKRTGCKVRPVGTSHSFDGVVQQPTEKNVIVVSLAHYVPEDDWNGVLTEYPENDDTHAAAIKMGAGKTFLDLMAIARPKGYLMVTQTAGWIFSLAGVFMNPSVHGSTLKEDRLCSLLVSVQVMLSSGETKVIKDQEEIKYWRGSLGLLGIVTGVEVRLRRDKGISMNTYEQQFKTWDAKIFNDFFSRVIDESDAAEFFFNPYDDKIVALSIKYEKQRSFLSKTMNSVVRCINTNNAKTYEEQYRKLQAELPNLPLPTAGKDFIPELLEKTNSYICNDLKATYGEILCFFAMNQVKASWKDNFRKGPRDGYYVDPKTVMQYNNLCSLIPCEEDGIKDNTLFNVLSETRNVLQKVINDDSFGWCPPLPVEFRFVDTKTDTFVLDPLDKKKYISIELFSVLNPERPTNRHAHIFEVMETMWFLLGKETRVHLGKEFGFGRGRTNDLLPFQNLDIISSVYNQSIRQKFVPKIAEYDPIKLFSAGEGMRLLGLSDVPFDPDEKNKTE